MFGFDAQVLKGGVCIHFEGWVFILKWGGGGSFLRWKC